MPLPGSRRPTRQAFVPCSGVHAGIRAEAVPQIQTAEWSKYALFLSWTAPAVLTRLESYKLYTHPDTALEPIAWAALGQQQEDIAVCVPETALNSYEAAPCPRFLRK